MINIALSILEFIVIFLVLYLMHKIFFRKKLRKYDKKTLPVNVKYMVIKYNIDVQKIGYKKVLNELCMCDSFIVALSFSVTKILNNTYVRILVCFLLTLPMFFITYYLMSKYYKRKSDK